MRVGKKEEAAKPKAKATVLATKLGWVDPKISGNGNGPKGGNSGIFNFLLIRDCRIDDFFIKSWEMEVDKTKSKPLLLKEPRLHNPP